MQRLGALALDSRLQLLAKGRVGRHLGDAPSVEQRAHVLSGAADHDRHAARRLDLADDGARPSQVQRQTELFIRVDEVQHVVDDPGALIGRGLGRADVHVPVDLPRVGADDLAVHQRRQPQREGALPHRGRADDGEQAAGA